MKRNLKQYATLKDVARLAGTSTTSVSAVINGSENRYISDELRDRVLVAAKELNYMKSAVASSLKGIERKTLALLVPQFQNPFFLRIAVSIETVAYHNDFTIFICNTLDDPDREMEIIEKVIGQRVDGIIISPTANGAENTKVIRDLNIPYVVVERPLVGINEYDFVTSNNLQLGTLAGKYLLEYGHRNFGFVEWVSDVNNIGNRKQGFENAISGRYDTFQVEGCTELTREQGYHATKKLLENNQGITALVYGMHVLAEGGLEYIREHNIKIPDDISILLMGSPEWALLNNPPFTCIKQPESEMGLLAAGLLFERIADSKLSRPFKHRQHMFENHIIEGATVKRIQK